jgi:hypothetical protein
VGVQRPTTRQDLCGRHLGRGFSLYGGAAAVGLSLCILSSSAVMSSHDSAIAENLPTFLDAVLYGHLVGGWVGGSRGTTPTLPALSHHTTPSHAVSDGRAGLRAQEREGAQVPAAHGHADGRAGGAVPARRPGVWRARVRRVRRTHTRAGPNHTRVAAPVHPRR